MLYEALGDGIAIAKFSAALLILGKIFWESSNDMELSLTLLFFQN